MNIVIVESPSKAKTITKYLGKGYRVVSSYGHVRSIKPSEGAVLPEQDFAIQYIGLEKSEKHVNEICTLALKADTIYLATDPDREGESIAWHILELLKERSIDISRLNVKRVTFHEITKKAVLDAVAHPKDLDINLIEAQRARQALDWLVGFTLSPVLWSKIPGGRGTKRGKVSTALSAGRVQSVALRLICECENERDRFKSEEYWSIKGIFAPKNAKTKQFSASLYSLKNNKIEKFSFRNQQDAEAAKVVLELLEYSTTNVEKKSQKRKASAPFTTSTMLQEASRKLGFSAKQTAQLAQKLYEGMDIGGETQGLITYMRTDSVTISSSAIESIREYVAGTYGGDYLPEQGKLYKTKVKNAQEAHEAIRPTNVNNTPEMMAKYLDRNQLRLYDLIWRRTVASQMNDAIFDATSLSISDPLNTAVFKATGSVLVFEGFLKVYSEGRDENKHDNEEKASKDGENNELPILNVGDNLLLYGIEDKQHFTQPPARYTDASLIKKMEELGIGRPSTYPSIISILQDRGYVSLERRAFIPEVKGRVVSSFLSHFFQKYVEYGFTADLEQQLDEISNGNLYYIDSLKTFWHPFKKQIDEIMLQDKQTIISTIEHDLLSIVKEGERSCPKCNNGILGLRFGKYGAFVGCSNYPECTYTKENLTTDSGAADESSSSIDTGYPRELGFDANGIRVTLRKGPYGEYYQLESDPVKRASISKNTPASVITLEAALKLLQFPRVLGNHPETGKPIKAGIGRFGPYVEHDKSYTSIGRMDPATITLEVALEQMAKPKTPRRNTKSK